ncbi:hypothetical protein DSM26151_00560 [Agromyces marinus]|uniref:Secreted protein n=1 Tax=Agromyces marinus TaxID=1389020 RepID=A0ABM8H1T6_9MICO|nr:hypothetical protein [Agromyces marinus]UIP57201.1 hypothetical protein DSM26151_00560 [Agromyces marinus]BDZ54713.1 hypothetical protein GCM10025870_17860 [Agromyces marinus]
MKLKMRVLLALPMAAIFAVGAVAAPASAVTQTGFRSCSVNYIVKITTVSKGTTSVWVAGWSDYETFSTSTTHHWYSNVHGGEWGVSAPTLSAAGATCA